MFVYSYVHQDNCACVHLSVHLSVSLGTYVHPWDICWNTHVAVYLVHQFIGPYICLCSVSCLPEDKT